MLVSLLAFLCVSLIFSPILIYSQTNDCYQMKITPDNYPNDISWKIAKQYKNGTSMTLEKKNNTGAVPNFISDCWTATDDDCFAFTVYDSYGDGFCCHSSTGSGYINISYNDNMESIEGRIYSEEYEDSGIGGYEGSETFLFEDGELVQYCSYGDPTNAEGCFIDLSIDIVFIFDTSFDMANDVWKQKKFARYILSDNVPSDTRVGSISFGTTTVTNFGLVQNSESTRDMIDTDTAEVSGQQKTTDALVAALAMLVPERTPERQAYVLIMTNDESNDDDMCEYYDEFNDNGIDVIIVAETTSTTFELTCLTANVDDYLIFMESFDDIVDYTGDVEKLVCNSEPDFWVTEVMIDSSVNEKWIELYNHGIDFDINDLQFLGLVSASISTSATFAQGDFYIFGNTDPCSGSCSYQSATVSSSLSATNFYITVLNATTAQVVDTVSYIASSWPSVTTGFTYQLEDIYYANSQGGNWRESCERGGSPGSTNVYPCPSVCDVDKCQSNGDADATCDGITSGVVYNASCSCSSEYYNDDDLRVCEPVETVSSCTATVYSSQTEVVFTESTSSEVTGYTIYIGSSTFTDVYNSPETVTVSSSSALNNGVYVTINAIINGNTKESAQVECVTVNEVGNTKSPTRNPTDRPTTTAAPTHEPTAAPTYAGCGSALKLDLLFIVDSSGSVKDSLYANWESELSFAKAVVNNSLPGDTRVGFINFSGCPSGSFTQCQNYNGNNRLWKMWSLIKYGTNHTAVYNAIDDIGPDEFLGGYTWTDDILLVAYNEFVNQTIDGRSQMLIIITDGNPTNGHEPCEIDNSGNTWKSDTLQALEALGVTIIAVAVEGNNGIGDEFFECLVESPDYYFKVNGFSQLANSSLLENIGAIVCDDSIELVINEVMIHRDLRFIEVYVSGPGVSLNGFRFEGLISGTINDISVGAAQFQYWVISDREMNSTVCGFNCSSDYIAKTSNGFTIDTSMTNSYWYVEIYNANDELIDSVTYESIYFPNVDDLYTYELIYEDYDNDLGGNWEESCYEYGTPQEPNQEPCPCSFVKCQEKGDGGAYCNSDGTDCVCSDDFIASGGVCVPIYPPNCCYAWWTDIASLDEVYIQWCGAQTSAVEGYRLTIGNTVYDFDYDELTYTYYVGSNRPNISVQTITQSSPLILSDSIDCPYSYPTLAPTDMPTDYPTPPQPSGMPSATPTFVPSHAPTITVDCKYIIVSIENDVDASLYSLEGSYKLESNDSTLDTFVWNLDTTTRLYYDDNAQRWIIESSSSYIYLGYNETDQTPPLGTNTYYSIGTSEFVDILMYCSLTPKDITPSPTSPTSPPTTPSPTIECTHLSISGSGYDLTLPQSTFDSDGKSQWTDGYYTISWYDIFDRWTFDAYTNFYIAGSDQYGSQPDLSVEKDWTNLNDDTDIISLTLECVDAPTSMPTTGAPTESLADACTFPSGILHGWNLDELRSWNRCYYESYSDDTVTSDITSNCDFSDTVYWFIGAIRTNNLGNAYIGSYVLSSEIANYAGDTSTAVFINGTYWYHVEDTAIGFADSEDIALSSCDVNELDSDNRLCWHLLGSGVGGYRAGKWYPLNNDNDWLKVVYYLNCPNRTFEMTPAPTASGFCDIIQINSSSYNTIVYDNGIDSGGKDSWQSLNNVYSLGWYSYLNSWVLTVSSDNSYWSLSDDDFSVTPPFDMVYTWDNLLNSQTMDFTMTCLNASEGTPAPTESPALPDCDYLCIDSNVGALDGCYELQNTFYDGYVYYLSSSSGIFIHYLAFSNKWAIDDSGASYIQNGFANSTSIPNDDTFIDYSTDNYITVDFYCSPSDVTPSPTMIDDYYTYVWPELRYTEEQIGFSMTKTFELGDGNYSRDYSEFINDAITDVTQIGTWISDVFINGTKQWENGDLTGLYLKRNLSQPSNVTIVLAQADTSNYAYYDDSSIRVWFQLSDDDGKTALNLDGVTVDLTISCTTCSGGTALSDEIVSCATDTIDEYRGFPTEPCTVEIPDITEWKSGSEETIDVWVSLKIDSVEIATSNIETVTLAEEIVLAPKTNGGLYCKFATYPLEIGEEFNVDCYVNTNDAILDYYLINAEFDVDSLQFVSFTEDSSLWSPITQIYTTTSSNTNGEISFYTDRITDTTDTSGNMTYVGYFTFYVASSAGTGTTADKFDVTLQTATDDSGNTLFSNSIGSIYDITGGPFTFANMQVIDTTTAIGIFAGITTRDIFNTGYLSGTRVRKSVLLNLLYYDRTESVSAKSCVTSSPSILSYGTRSDGCNAYAESTDIGGGIITMTMTAEDDNGKTQTTTMDWRVWFPTSFDVRPDRNVTIINRINTPWAYSGDIVYENVRVWVYSIFTCDTLETDWVVINPYLNNFISTDSSILVLWNVDDSPLYQFQGNETYDNTDGEYVNLTLYNSNYDTMLVYETIFVTADLSTAEEIHSIGGVLVTHTKYDYETITVDDNDYITIFGHLQQELTAELDYGSIHVWVKLEDGTLMDLNDELYLNFTVESNWTNDLAVTILDKSDWDTTANIPPAYGYVKIGARTREWDPMVRVDWYTDDATRLRATGYVWVRITLPDIVNITATASCDENKLTRSTDPAYNVWGYPLYCDITVIVWYDDGTFTDFTDDSRTVYDIPSPYQGGLLQFDSSNGNRVMVNESSDSTLYGFETIQVSIPDLIDGTVANIEFEVVIFDKLTINAQPYPSSSSSLSYKDSFELTRVGCANIYSGASINITGNLTDGNRKDLTDRDDTWLNMTTSGVVTINDVTVYGFAIGTTDIYATFENDDYSHTSNSIEFSVTNDGSYITLVSLNAITDELFEDVYGTKEYLQIDIEWSDGSVMDDLVSWISSSANTFGFALTQLIVISSSDPTVIYADNTDGSITLLDNWWRGVNITVSTDVECNITAVATLIASNAIEEKELVYPNLYPDTWDVDVENNDSVTGLQFENIDSLLTGADYKVNYTFYINAMEGSLLSFDLKFWFDDSVLLVQDCWEYGTWEDRYFAWNSDTYYGELHIAGAGGSFSTGYGLIAVAQCLIYGSEVTGIDVFEGQIIELSYYDSSNNIQHIFNTEMVAANGYQQVGASETMVPIVSNMLARQASVQSNSYSSCGDYLFDGDTSGCCDMSYWGDVNGDCKTTAFDAHAIIWYFSSIYATVYDLIDLDSLSYNQRRSMDLTLDYLDNMYPIQACLESTYDSPCPTEAFDVTYLLRMVVSKYLALNITSVDDVFTQTGDRFILTGYAPFLIQDDANVFYTATNNATEVFFEINSTLNSQNFIDGLVTGTYVGTTSTGNIVIQADYTSLSNSTDPGFLFRSINNFTEECFDMAILYRTLTEDGAYTTPASDLAVDRHYAYHGTDYFDTDALQSPYEGYNAIFEICIFDSGATPAPTFAPIITNAPTPSPTQTPTNEDEGPELMECRFEDHGTAIWMRFSEDTNRAGFGGEPFSCLHIFTPPTFVTLDGTGGDSRCIWVNTTTVRIELGYGFDVRVGDYMELVGNNIVDIDEITTPATGLCEVYPAYNPPSTIAPRITGTTHLGGCQDLELSMDTTLGLFPPITITWSIDPQPSGYTLTKDENVFYIPSEYLTESEYEVSVKVKSRHGYSDDTDKREQERSINIFVANDDTVTPQVSLTSPLFINISSVEDLIVSVDTSSDACDSNEDDNEYTYKWAQVTTLEYNPFGETVSLSVLSVVSGLELTHKTLYVPADYLTASRYYLFRCTVTDSNDNVNYAYVGVYVQLVTPFKKGTQTLELSTMGSYTVTIFDFFSFDNAAPYNTWTYNWLCDGPLGDCFGDDVGSAHEILISNNSTDNNFPPGDYEISCGVSNSLGNEHYVSNSLFFTMRNDSSDFISVSLDTNVGAINTNQRIRLFATSTDYSMNTNGLLYDFDFTYTDIYDNVDESHWAVSIVDENLIIDGELDNLIKDGQSYSYQLDVTKLSSEDDSSDANITYESTGITGTSYIELYANRGPNGGVCEVTSTDSDNYEYTIRCYGWTDEWWDLPLTYNFMVLDYCQTDTDCDGELVCENWDVYGSSEDYEVSYCRSETGPTAEAYLRDWGMGSKHTFKIFSEGSTRNKTIRASIRDNRGFITNYDLFLEVASVSDETDYENLMDDADENAETASTEGDLDGIISSIVTVDVVNSDGYKPYDDYRSTIFESFVDLFESLMINNGTYTNNDRLRVISQALDELLFDEKQFYDADKSGDIAFEAQAIFDDIMNRYYKINSNEQLKRDLSVWEMMFLAWSGGAAQSGKNIKSDTLEELQDAYIEKMVDIASAAMLDRVVDEAAFNISINDVSILASYESSDVIFTDKSTCGGDYINLPLQYEQLLSNPGEWDYLYCLLIVFNGSLLNPQDFGLSTPWLYFRIYSVIDEEAVSDDVTNYYDGTTSRRLGGITKNRRLENVLDKLERRQLQDSSGSFNSCYPFTYTVPSNPNTSLLSYEDRLDATEYSKTVTWAECVARAGNTTVVASDCYVLTHDEGDTICACNSSYDIIGVVETTYDPNFNAIKSRTNDENSWEGQMECIAPVLWLLLLGFLFSTIFYFIPVHDKHKAMLAVRKGLPQKERGTTYFKTAEGKTYQVMQLQASEYTWPQLYIEIYKIRFRNDHLCLWFCKGDPGSNISHNMKACLVAFYTILWMTLLVLFYTWDTVYGYTTKNTFMSGLETEFPDTLFAFLIAFLTLLPVYCCAWCISLIRPKPYTEDEIEQIIDDRMPFETRDAEWDEDYSSADEDEEMYNQDGQFEDDGMFAPPDDIIPENGNDNENMDNIELQRIFTDIDEEVEYLEDNYMPEETMWRRQKLRKYKAKNVYEKLEKGQEWNDKNIIDDNYNSDDSMNSNEDRRGFNGLTYNSHKQMAVDAERYGFINMNDDTGDFDVNISTKLNRMYGLNTPNINHEREASKSRFSKLGKIFKKKKSEKIDDNSIMDSLNNDQTAENSQNSPVDETPEQSTTQLSQQSSQNRRSMRKKQNKPTISSMNAPMQSGGSIQRERGRSSKSGKGKKKQSIGSKSPQRKSTSKGKTDNKGKSKSNSKRKQSKSEKKRKNTGHLRTDDTKDLPSDSEDIISQTPSLGAEGAGAASNDISKPHGGHMARLPSSSYDIQNLQVGSSSNVLPNQEYAIQLGQVDENKEEIGSDSDNHGRSPKNRRNKGKNAKRVKKQKEIDEKEEEAKDAANLLAVHLTARRKRQRFVRILELGRLYQPQIKDDSMQLSKIIDQALNRGDWYLFRSNKLVKRANKLIKNNHPLFESVDNESNKIQREKMQKMLHNDELMKSVWGGLDDPTGIHANDQMSLDTQNAFLTFNPSELRKIENIPEQAPHERDFIEQKTTVDDGLWKQANFATDAKNLVWEDKSLAAQKKAYMIDENGNKVSLLKEDKRLLTLDDVWEETGNLPPELLKALEEPYYAWHDEKDQYVPPQKPMTQDEEEDYRNKMRHHFKQRGKIMDAKYPIPFWFKWIIWGLLILVALLLVYFYLLHGVKLGAEFAYTADDYSGGCDMSVPEKTRFDYDYSVLEAKRRTPAPAPDEAEGGMSNEWDYRVRFSIAAFITFFTSFFIAQPIIIGIIVLFIVCCCPQCLPIYNKFLNIICCKKRGDDGFREFMGAGLTINTDTEIMYDKIGDESEYTQTGYTQTGRDSSVYTRDQSSVGNLSLDDRQSSNNVRSSPYNSMDARVSINEGKRQPLLKQMPSQSHTIEQRGDSPR